MPRTGRWPPFDQANPPPAPAPLAEPPLFLFETGVEPIYSHPLWRLPGVVPSVRIDVRYHVDDLGNFSYEPAAGPHDTARGFVGMLLRMMAGFGPYFGPDHVPFRWYAIPAGFGGTPGLNDKRRLPNQIPLLGHPADALEGGARGPFIAAGVRANRAWSDECLGHLADELKARGLPDPLCWILTSENGVNDDYAGHMGDPDTGWVTKALADWRSGDPEHTIDGRRTFRQYFDQARALDGSPIPRYQDKRLGIPAGRSPHNDESSERYRGAIRLCWDWAREQAFSRPARAAFARDPARPEATVRVGEYGAACDSKWAPVRWRPGSFMHQMGGIFYTDLQCPYWYGGFPDSLLAEDPFDKDSPAWHTLGNWKRAVGASGPDTEESNRRLALEIHKAMATAHARSAPHAALAPYVHHTAPEDDMVAYLKHCRTLGLWAVNVFMPEQKAETYEYWRRVVARVLE
jgi:hypothetical protein